MVHRWDVFEREGRKLGVVAIAESLFFDCAAWFGVRIKGHFCSR